jgi:hypothetical protein
MSSTTTASTTAADDAAALAAITAAATAKPSARRTSGDPASIVRQGFRHGAPRTGATYAGIATVTDAMFRVIAAQRGDGPGGAAFAVGYCAGQGGDSKATGAALAAAAIAWTPQADAATSEALAAFVKTAPKDADAAAMRRAAYGAYAVNRAVTKVRNAGS